MEVKGNIGTSPASFDVSLDAALNLVASLSYKDPGSAFTLSVSATGMPIAVLLQQLTAKLSTNPIVTEVEQALVSAIELYVASQAPKS